MEAADVHSTGISNSPQTEGNNGADFTQGFGSFNFMPITPLDWESLDPLCPTKVRERFENERSRHTYQAEHGTNDYGSLKHLVEHPLKGGIHFRITEKAWNHERPQRHLDDLVVSDPLITRTMDTLTPWYVRNPISPVHLFAAITNGAVPAENLPSGWNLPSDKMVKYDEWPEAEFCPEDGDEGPENSDWSEDDEEEEEEYCGDSDSDVEMEMEMEISDEDQQHSSSHSMPPRCKRRRLAVSRWGGSINAELHLPLGKVTAARAEGPPLTFSERPETPPLPFADIRFSRDPDFVNRGDILDQIDQRCSEPAHR
ncbi:hypothetical protein N0V85_005149 [Neurospora sp. IMI 360204]|nr:hypothetical protein N0V85_005149 [Neurospora sp. IMI 360204]